MKKIRFILLFLIIYSMLLPASTAFAKGGLLRGQRFSSSGKSASAFQRGHEESVKRLQHRRHLQTLEEEMHSKGHGRRHGNSKPKEEDSCPPKEPPPTTNPVDADAALIYGWVAENQKNSPLGLVTSYPADAALHDQAFTYDQALSGILLLQQGDRQGAQKIFDFLYSQWDDNGLWTVYNSQSADGAKVELEKLMGPNAWAALFALQYYSKTGDANGLDLATKAGHWIANLPHQEGGAAMGNSIFWATKYSVENNLDYYAALKILSTKATTQADRQFFTDELNGVKDWLKTQGYDPATGLFKRGAYGDTVKAVDASSWAVLVIGPADLKKDFGVDVDLLVSNIESTFAVQADGSFGQNALTAKGFDFSDSVNASAIGRSGLNWVEGTNHMIAVYKLLAGYYSQAATRDDTKAAYYTTRADYFSGQNAAAGISQNGTVGYSYTDTAGVRVFSDNPFWFTASGPSLASSAWVYYSKHGFNPFAESTTS